MKNLLYKLLVRNSYGEDAIAAIMGFIIYFIFTVLTAIILISLGYSSTAKGAYGFFPFFSFIASVPATILFLILLFAATSAGKFPNLKKTLNIIAIIWFFVLPALNIIVVAAAFMNESMAMLSGMLDQLRR